MVIICENFTLSELEMPYLPHLRAFKTAPSLSKRTVIPTAKQEESREIKRKTRKRTDLYIAQYQLFKTYAMENFNAISNYFSSPIKKNRTFAP